jgi:hypothetical protein
MPYEHCNITNNNRENTHPGILPPSLQQVTQEITAKMSQTPLFSRHPPTQMTILLPRLHHPRSSPVQPTTPYLVRPLTAPLQPSLPMTLNSPHSLTTPPPSLVGAQVSPLDQIHL